MGRPQWRLPWADLPSRVYAVDIVLCNQCGGRIGIPAAITDPEVVRKTLDHLRRPATYRPTAVASPLRRPIPAES